jgi:hypothetical protein
MDIDTLLSHWPLDAWSIGPHTFKKITEIVPLNSTILEFGSGRGTELLSKFYKMKSIEDDKTWINKYDSTYFEVPLVPSNNKFPEFPTDPYWFDENILKEKIKSVGSYDAILVDGPKGYRGGLYYNHQLFDFRNKIVIFDDVHSSDHHKLMTMIANDVERPFFVFNDTHGKKYGILV